MSKYSLPDSIKFPESAFKLSEHLGFTKAEQVKWAWLEISGAVLSHYLIDQQQRLDALLTWFYQELRFCPHADYYSTSAADLAKCITSRQGNSTTLAIVLSLLAKQLDLKLEMVFIPGFTLLKSELNDQTQFIDPLNGKTVDKAYIHALVRGELGNHAPLKSKYFKPVTEKRLFSRMLHELKASSIMSHQYEQALECCNLLMQWHKDDIYLNRERAFIAEQLGCIKVAAQDLQHFVDNNPHDPVSELVKMQIQELNEHAETYH
ncbi:MAG: SirB1 family protein [Parashewanella sp.]